MATALTSDVAVFHVCLSIMRAFTVSDPGVNNRGQFRTLSKTLQKLHSPNVQLDCANMDTIDMLFTIKTSHGVSVGMCHSCQLAVSRS